MKTILLFAGFTLLNTFGLRAQVVPVVTGDQMLCPEGTGSLSTTTFDTYQWYQRYFMTEDTFETAGATSQTLDLNYYDHSASYFIVEVTQEGETGISAEFFVDGYAFAGPVVSTTGDFNTGENGEAILCQGDTISLEFLQPYTTNIKWYNNNVQIPGETNSILEVSVAGSYTVSGAPEVCPDYVVTQGIPVDVIMDNCGLGLENNSKKLTTIWPNPAVDFLTVLTTEDAGKMVSVFDQSGRLISKTERTGIETTIDLSGLKAGVYLLEAAYGSTKEVLRFVVQ